MEVSRLELHNFKHFGHLEASFAPKVNLFIGVNGSGKTSLLEGIAVALGGFFHNKAQDISNKRYIAYDEIRIANGLRQEMAVVKATWDRPEGRIEWERAKNRDGRTRRADVGTMAAYGASIQQQFEAPPQANPVMAPLIAYYSTQRLFSDAQQRKNSKYDPALGRHNGYLRCLDTSSIKPVLQEWLGNAVTKRATLAIKGIDQHDQVLDNVERGIQNMLLSFLELPNDFPLKIYQDPEQNNALCLEYDGNPMPLEYYSDGFRNLIFLVIDMVWRASQLNPWLALPELSESLRGAVLIDELDLHLHPKWQGKAIPFLQTLFPRVQYFITTHSPMVISHFKPQYGQLYAIRGQQMAQMPPVFGHEANYVFKYVLQVPERPESTQNRLDSLFEAIEREEIPAQDFEELRSELGGDDPDLMRAQALMEWNAYKKENPDAVY